MKNKDYLTLANERHEQKKQDKAQKQEIELLKIQSREDIEILKIEAKEKQQRQKRINTILGVIFSIVGFITIFAIILGFAKLITKN